MRQFLCIAIVLGMLVTTRAAAESDVDGAQAVLARARSASGHGWAEVHTLSAEGDEAAIGLIAHWHLDIDVATSRFRQLSQFPLFRTGDVYDGATDWVIDRSGAVHPLNGEFARQEALTDAWIASRQYLNANVTAITPTHVSHRGEAGKMYAVLNVTPKGGIPIDLWFDPDTGWLVRTDEQLPISHLTTRYSDYRQVSGLMLPFRIVNDVDGNIDTVSVTNYAVDSATDASAFSAPQQIHDVMLEHPTTIAAETNGSVVIEATLNGMGPYAFILDTGGHDILTPAAVTALGLNVTGSGRSGGAGEGTVEERDTKVRTLKIGDAVFSDQHFYVIPLDYDTVERGRRPPLAGILGLEIFERVAVAIDYRDGAVTLSPFAKSPDVCAGTTVDLTFNEDIPLAQGRIDGVDGLVAVDTGNSGLAVVQAVWAAKKGLTVKFANGVNSVSFGEGGMLQNWISRNHTVELGEARIPDQLVSYATAKSGAFSSRTEAANVGYEYLAHFNLYFDYSRQTLCLEPRAGFVPPAFNRSGMSVFKEDPDTFAVVAIRPGSPASEAGILVGDKLTEINGQGTAAMSGDEVSKLSRGAPGTILHITVDRQGQLLTFAVTLAEPRWDNANP